MFPLIYEQESFPVASVPPAFRIPVAGVGWGVQGVCPTHQPPCRPPGYRPLPVDADPFPWMQTPPLDADPFPGCRAHPSGCRPSPQCRPPPSLGCRPPGHVTSDACWEANLLPLEAAHVTCDACWEANPLPTL